MKVFYVIRSGIVFELQEEPEGGILYLFRHFLDVFPMVRPSKRLWK